MPDFEAAFSARLFDEFINGPSVTIEVDLVGDYADGPPE